MGNRIHVLLVDASTTDTETVLRPLRDDGFDPSAERIITAEAFQSALDLHPWDLAVADAGPSAFGALDALAVLAQRDLDVPVIVIADSLDTETAVEIMRAGARDCLLRSRLDRLATAARREIENARLRRTRRDALLAQRKQSEAALRLSEEKYRTVADFTYDWEYWIGPDGKYLYVSPSCERLTGYRAEEFVNRPDLLITLVHPDDREKVVAHLAAVQDGDRLPHRIEFRIVTRQSEMRWIAHHCQPVYGKDGKWLGRRASNRDISDSKRAQERMVALSKFPAEDPNPVLRVDPDGVLLYANRPSAPLLAAWQRQVGESVPAPWHEWVASALYRGQKQEVEARCGERAFSFVLAPVNVGGYVNVYGHDITDRKTAEERLALYQRRLRSLAAKLALAEENERRRIAAGLHDHVVQTLASAKMKLQTLRAKQSMTGEAAPLLETQGFIEQAMRDTRDLLFDLSPPILYELGFEPAVEWLAEKTQAQYGIVVSFQTDAKEKSLDAEVRGVLFRAVRELLMNVAKHAAARHVRVRVARDDDRIRVEVTDDGCGFDTANPPAYSDMGGGFGLFDVRERLDYLGGQLEIRSRPGHGTRATLWAPLQKVAATPQWEGA